MSVEPAALDALMADARLVELCDLQRTSDEFLDVINLSENQHSDVLAWLFDSREGHGQGDEILRDFLIAASVAASNSSCGLDARFTTAKFFQNWTPARIRTTSFGSAFCARELGMKESERVDLFVIDTQNRFILLIENKAGTKHVEAQLEKYRASFQEAVRKNSKLRTFDHVYIALDRVYDGEDATDRACAKTWLHLNYSWLENSANRALRHVERGNTAARLVVSYCNRQTDWESPSIERCVTLASELHHDHPKAVADLIDESPGRVERKWFENAKGDALLYQFLLQNRGAVALLKDTKGMISLAIALRREIQDLPSENLHPARAKLDICPSGWDRYIAGRYLPVFMRVKFSGDTKTTFDLALCWNAKNAAPDRADEARQKLTRVNSRFSTHSDSNWRRVVIGRSLTTAELKTEVKKLNKELAAQFDGDN